MAEGRWGFEAFDCAPGLRLEAHERLQEVEMENVHQRIARLEETVERLERRVWVTVYGVVGVIVAQWMARVLEMMP